MIYQIYAKRPFRLPSILQMGYGEDPKITRYGPARRDLYIIHFILRGKGTFLGRELHAGQGFLIRPGSYEFYYPDETDPWSFVWMMSEDAEMESVFSLLGGDTPYFEYGATAYARQIGDYIRKNDQAAVTPALLSVFFANLIEGSFENDHREKMSSVYVSFAKSYFENNYFQNVTISRLTAILGVSQPYLYRVFKEETGVSPKEYLGECRMKKARRLLSVTDASITEIASAVGYADVLTFSRAFRKAEGCSPSRYRETRRPPAKEDDAFSEKPSGR